MRKEERIEKLEHFYSLTDYVLNETWDLDGWGLLDGEIGAEVVAQAYRLHRLAERLLGKARGVIRGWDYAD